MLGYLRGVILENAIQADGKIILGIGSDSQGFVGYSLSVPRHPNYELLPAGKSAEFFIHTHVREDALDLYGFVTRAEKDLFLTLLSVNGIGPKGALSILSNAEPSQLIEAIVQGDKDLLTKIPGIGKKTAERVVLELAEPLRKKLDTGLPRSKGVTVASGKPQVAGSQTLRDAVSALVGLGYREGDVAPIVSRAFAESAQPPKAEDLIKTALRLL